MDFSLKQWGNQHESEEQEEPEQQQQPSAKMPKLLLDSHKQPPIQNPSSSPLSLFVPQQLNSKICNLSALSDSTTRLPSMSGCYFSLAQWQELELQALIYRYMSAGATVPPELLQPIKKSIIHSPYFIHNHPLQQYSYYQPALLQTGYWGRAAMDPEPGRCRRTDGKKWRCSRDVVPGQKYCERHVHRGRNRSRKPVENPTPTTTTAAAAAAATTTNTIATVGAGGGGAFNSTSSIHVPPAAAVTNETSFSFSGQTPSNDIFHLKNGGSDSKPEIKGVHGPQTEINKRNEGHILRHFFDDWPRTHQESDTVRKSNSSSMNSATGLSISMPGNSSSDVSLKLSTGSAEEQAGSRDQSQVNWTGGWGTTQVASMGGPLAEALRSSTSNLSPTSVLHHLLRSTASETSYVSS